MEKNYYEILEVNKNASPEIIEKAYKTLVKKYHPDLQDNSLKANYEEKIKKINEAYEILSNVEKRKEYNFTLENNEVSKDDYNILYNENINLKNEINFLKNSIKTNISSSEISNAKNNDQNNISQSEFNQRVNSAINKAYYDAYIQDLKSRGFKIRYKKNSKDFLALFLTIVVILIIGFILWHIPFTKDFLINLYEDNPIINLIVNCIKNIFS